MSLSVSARARASRRARNARRRPRPSSSGHGAANRLDLASLGSVRAAAAEIPAGHQRLDLLINNAGLTWPA